MDSSTNQLDTLDVHAVSDSGFSGAEADLMFIPDFIQNCYNATILNTDPTAVRCDVPTTTACRSPVSIQVSV